MRGDFVQLSLLKVSIILHFPVLLTTWLHEACNGQLRFMYSKSVNYVELISVGIGNTSTALVRLLRLLLVLKLQMRVCSLNSFDKSLRAGSQPGNSAIPCLFRFYELSQ